MGARTLARQRLVEEAPVVQAGQGIEVGELARLPEAPRILDRRPRVLRERLELADVLVRILVPGPAREHRQIAERLRLAGQRDGQAGVDRVLVAVPLRLRIGVGHRDRAGEPAVGRAGDRVPLGLLHGQPERCDERLAALCLGEHRERRVGPSETAGGLQRPRQDLVEVDRARKLPEDVTPPALLLGPLEGARQLAPEVVHPRVEAGNDLGDPLVRPGVRAPAHDEQGEQGHHESAQAHADPGQKCRHRKPPAETNEAADSL